MAQLDFIATEDEKHLKQIQNIDEYFASLIKPKNFEDTADNILIKNRKEFQAICAALMINGIQDPEKLTIFKFFSLIEFFESQSRKRPKR